MENPAGFETTNRRKNLQEQHKAWLLNAKREIVTGIGFYFAVGIPSVILLEAIGIDLPVEILAVLPVSPTLIFLRNEKRRQTKR